MANLKKKILFLVTQSEWGGAQEYVFNLATNLDKNQYDVLVLAGRQGQLFNELTQAQVPWQKLKYTRRAINPTLDKLAIWELYKIFKKEKPDIIHLNSSKIGFLGSLAGQIYKKINNKELRIIYTAHGWVFTEPLPRLTKKLYFWIEKISAKWKDIIITVCEKDRQIALQNKFKSKIITIHNAVDPSMLNFFDKDVAKNKLFQLLTSRQTSQTNFQFQNSKLIGTIANLYPAKGINYLIEAANILIKENPDYIFIVFGEGPERKKLELLITNYQLHNNFFLVGNTPNAHKLLKGFDLFILPSVKEGLPYAILKAMAAQIPIITTRVGGLPEILPEQCLVKTNVGAIHESPLQLRDKISQYLAGRLPLLHYQTNSFPEFLDKTIALY